MIRKVQDRASENTRIHIATRLAFSSPTRMFQRSCSLIIAKADGNPRGQSSHQYGEWR